MILVSIWNYEKFTVKYKYNLNNINETDIGKHGNWKIEISLENILRYTINQYSLRQSK